MPNDDEDDRPAIHRAQMIEIMEAAATAMVVVVKLLRAVNDDPDAGSMLVAARGLHADLLRTASTDFPCLFHGAGAPCRP